VNLFHYEDTSVIFTAQCIQGRSCQSNDVRLPVSQSVRPMKPGLELKNITASASVLSLISF